jgi:hypothetical protein
MIMEKGILAQPQARLFEFRKKRSQLHYRFIRYDLAGRYSVKANSAETQAVDLERSINHVSAKTPRWTGGSTDSQASLPRHTSNT